LRLVDVAAGRTRTHLAGETAKTNAGNGRHAGALRPLSVAGLCIGTGTRFRRLKIMVPPFESESPFP
jgi:hypothetical protein